MGASFATLCDLRKAIPCKDDLGMSTTYQLKSGVQVLALEQSTALLSHFGRRIWIELAGIESFLPWALDQATRPFQPGDLQTQWPSGEALPELGTLFDILLANHLLLVISQQRSAQPLITRTALLPFLQSFTDRNELVEIWLETIEHTAVRVLTTEVTAPDRLKMNHLQLISFSDQIPDFSQGQDQIFILFTNINRLDFAMKVNRAAVNSGQLVLPVICDASGAFVGPLLGPTGQPCLECWWAHRQANFKSVDWKLYQHPGLMGDDTQTKWPDHFWTGLNYFIENETLKILIEHLLPQSLFGCVILDFFNGTTSFEALHRRPGCLICRTGVKGIS